MAGACSVYFDFPGTSGAMPIARASAAAAPVADRLYVYGGLGVDNQPLSDMYIFDAGAQPVGRCERIPPHASTVLRRPYTMPLHGNRASVDRLRPCILQS